MQALLKSDLELVETLCTKDTYADIVQALTELPAYARLAAARGYDGSLQKQAQVKAAREQMKDTIQKLREKYSFKASLIEGFSLQTAADGTCLTRISPRVYRGL